MGTSPFAHPWPTLAGMARRSDDLPYPRTQGPRRREPLRRFKRGSFTLLLWAIAFCTAVAQPEWTFLQAGSGDNTIARDAIELENGEWVIALGSNIRHSEQTMGSSLVRLDGAGAAMGTTALRYSGLGVGVSTLLVSAAGPVFHAIGFAHDTAVDDRFGFIHYQIDQGLSLLDSARFMFDGTTDFTTENAAFDQDGNIFLAGSFGVGGSPLANRIQLLKITPDGDSLTSMLHGSGNGWCVPRRAIQYGFNMMLAVQGGNVGPPGGGKFLQFNNQLAYVTGFATRAVGGTGQLFPADSVMTREMCPHALPGGNIFSSGVYGNYFPDGYRAIVERISGTGELLDIFFPRSSYYSDYPACLNALVKIDENRYLFAMMENFQVYEDGSQPSRIHFYEMDTLFNVHCEGIVDGFDDNAYFFLERVKRTEDGGMLLIGSRKDLNVPGSKPAAWVMKLGPGSCVSGIGTNAASGARIFPNPGTNGFTITLSNGSAQSGRIMLFDAQGRSILVQPFVGGTGYVSTADLGTGIYFYRVVDRAGRSLAAGRWVKE